MIKRYTPFLLLTLLVLLALPPQLRAQQGNRAALVLDFGNGSVVTSCVAFTEPQITGRDLLERSGLAVAVAAFGGQTAVCSINGTGCPASDCWCQCQGSDCTRWSYWHGGSDSWAYALVGDELFNVENGMVEGWRWGAGTQSSADPPPFYRFDEVCALAATPTPIPLQPSPTTSSQVATAVPTATATSLPASATPLPSQTATPIDQTASEPTAASTPLPTATFGITRTPTPEAGAVAEATAAPGPTAVLSSLTLVAPTPVLDTQPLTPLATPVAPIVTVVVLPTIVVTAVIQPAAGVLPTVDGQPAAVAAVVPTAVARIGQGVVQGEIGEERPLVAAANESRPPALWLSYTIFALIALALGVVWWQGKRQGD